MICRREVASSHGDVALNGMTLAVVDLAAANLRAFATTFLGRIRVQESGRCQGINAWHRSMWGFSKGLTILHVSSFTPTSIYDVLYANLNPNLYIKNQVSMTQTYRTHLSSSCMVDCYHCLFLLSCQTAFFHA